MKINTDSLQIDTYSEIIPFIKVIEFLQQTQIF